MPKQQIPIIPTGSSSASGFLNSDKFVVGPGGQNEFNTSSEIEGDFAFFEDGVLTFSNAIQTGTNQITTDQIGEGVVVEILY